MSETTNTVARATDSGAASVPWLFEPDMLLPPRRSSQRMTPEKRLMVAILDDAIRAIRGRGVQRRLSSETRSWFLSEQTSWPFSFLNICDVLGLDAESVRRLVAKEIDQRAVGSPARTVSGGRVAGYADASRPANS